MEKFFVYSKAVQNAKNLNKPILSLETTMLTHGLPYPANLELA